MASNLARRGITVHSNICSLCGTNSESEDHLLIRCSITQAARECVLNCCGIPIRHFSNVSEFIDFSASWGHCPRKRLILNVIFYCLLWYMWLARNNKIFNTVGSSPTMIAYNVNSESYTSFKYRNSNGCGNWVHWCISPFKHFLL